MHTPDCRTPYQFTQTADLSATPVKSTTPVKSDPTLLPLAAAIRRGYVTLGGEGVKGCWMIDSTGARLISRGVATPYESCAGTLYFCQTADGGADSVLLTFAEYPANQSQYADTTVIP